MPIEEQNNVNVESNPHEVDNILKEMRDHLVGLKEQVTASTTAVSRSQGLNDKIEQMKQYQEKMASLNSCNRSKNRTELISGLQKENRQIIALEEENRQLRCALKEMELGLNLLMEEYRKTVTGFMKSDRLHEYAQESDERAPSLIESVDLSRYIKLAQTSKQCLTLAEQKIASDAQEIAQLRLENKTLHSICDGSP